MAQRVRSRDKPKYKYKKLPVPTFFPGFKSSKKTSIEIRERREERKKRGFSHYKGLPKLLGYGEIKSKRSGNAEAASTPAQTSFKFTHGTAEKKPFVISKIVFKLLNCNSLW